MKSEIGLIEVFFNYMECLTLRVRSGLLRQTKNCAMQIDPNIEPSMSPMFKKKYKAISVEIVDTFRDHRKLWSMDQTQGYTTTRTMKFYQLLLCSMRCVITDVAAPSRTFGIDVYCKMMTSKPVCHGSGWSWIDVPWILVKDLGHHSKLELGKLVNRLPSNILVRCKTV